MDDTYSHIRPQTETSLRKTFDEGGAKYQRALSMYQRGTDLFLREIERLENGLADFSTRDGVLMTSAGLVALLPLSSLETSSAPSLGMLKHFFIWVYPFLFISVVSFFLGTTRVHTLRDVLPVPEENTAEDFLDTYHQCFGAQDAWLRTRQRYRDTLFWHRITSVSTLLYFFAFAIHFYAILFVGMLSITVSLILTLVLFVSGILLLKRQSISSEEHGWEIYGLKKRYRFLYGGTSK
jgi:hypothetical protein